MSSSSRSGSPDEERQGRIESPGSPEQTVPRKRPRFHDPDEDDEGANNDDVKEDESEQRVNGANGHENGTSRGGDNDEKVEEDEEEEDDDDEDDDDEDDDDEDDEEDDDDDEIAADGERKKKRRRKSKKNRFLDIEAEVDDEEDEDDEADDFGDVADFIDERPGDEPISQDDTAHRRLNRDFGRNEEASVEDIVQRLKERHGRMAAARYNPDSDAVPQRLLMPGVNDPSLWKVRCKTGQEKDILASVFTKVYLSRNSANPIDISSVFCRDSLPGMLFVESRQSASVQQALKGIVGVFFSRGVELVPIEEMAPLLKIKKKEIDYQPGMWVRMRRGKYTGDLAQIVDTEQKTNGVVGIKFIPRIDLTPRDKRKEKLANNKVAGASSVRPPQRPFSFDDVKRIYGRSAVKSGAGGTFLFDNDEYIDGFCIKDVKFNMIATEDVQPTLEEISKFTGDDQATATYDLTAIADANKNITVSVLFPGDRVEVYEGEQTGLYGKVETVSPEVISVKAEGGDVHGQIVEVSAKSVRKRFEIGEHVKVLGGKNADASGMVVEVKGDVVTLMSDHGEQEIRAFTKDIRKAGDIAGITPQQGIYDLHDMVMLDSTTAGVIMKIEGGMLRILDQNGAVRIVSPQQVTPRRDNKNFAVATDSQGNDMKVGDAMKETEGENRSGEVINIFRSLFVFLYNREYSDNNGVFVARAQSLVSVTPKSMTNDLTKLNPAIQAQLPYGGASLMPPPSAAPNKNRLVNTLVVVVKGTSKGLMGVIKDIVGENARVELATNNKTLTINMNSLKRKDPRTGNTYPLDSGSFGAYPGRPAAGGYDVNPYGAPMGPPMGGQTPGMQGGRTPAVAGYGRTPNPYAGGGKTPNPYSSAGVGGRTPAPGWAGSGGKTPGWAGVGGKTPAPGFGAGGKTPAWAGGAGGKTPNAYGMSAGGRTPAPSYEQPEASSSRLGNGPVTAPTPYGGPTPGVISAPTPGANPYAAPTPRGVPTPYSAPTPYNAPTPGATLSAPTPGAVAPTPYGSGATPYGAPPGMAGPSGTSIPFDWALDFRNVIIEVGPSTRANTRNPMHFQRGTYDGKRFGYDTTGQETAHCISLDDPNVVEDIPAEYLRPYKPDGQGQVVVIIAGDDAIKGQQRMTTYENDGQWMMEAEAGDAGPMVVGEEALCRIWKT